MHETSLAELLADRAIEEAAPEVRRLFLPLLGESHRQIDRLIALALRGEKLHTKMAAAFQVMLTEELARDK